MATGDGNSKWWAWAAGAVAVVAAAAIVIAAGPGVSGVLSLLGIGDDAESAGPDRGVVLSEVSQNPDAMWGRQVVVSGRVERIISAHAMIVGNDALFTGDEVLVVSAEPLTRLAGGLGEDDVVGVRGQVARTEREALERQVDTSLAEAFAAYDGEGVIVADRILRDPDETELLELPGDTEARELSAGIEASVTIGDLLAEPDRYVGETVTVSGEVERVYSQHAFLVGDAKLLVVRRSTTPEVFVEPTAYVTGSVRRLDADAIERELGITLPAAAAGFDEVLVAESVHLVR